MKRWPAVALLAEFIIDIQALLNGAALNQISVCQNNRAIEDIAQLSNVTGEIVSF